MPALSTIVLFLLAGSGPLLIPGPSVLASVLGLESAVCVHTIAAALGLIAPARIYPITILLKNL